MDALRVCCVSVTSFERTRGPIATYSAGIIPRIDTNPHSETDRDYSIEHPVTHFRVGIIKGITSQLDRLEEFKQKSIMNGQSCLGNLEEACDVGGRNY